MTKTEMHAMVRRLNEIAEPCYGRDTEFKATGDAVQDYLARAAWHARWAIEIGRFDDFAAHLHELGKADRAVGGLIATVSRYGGPATVDEVLSAVELARIIVFDALKTGRNWRRYWDGK